MTTTTAADPRAWRADTVDEPASWYLPLSERCLSALEDVPWEWDGPQAVTDLRPGIDLPELCAAELTQALSALEAGRGFVVLAAGEPGRYSPERLKTTYWLIGQLLGRPLEQNVQGTLLYDVRDTGQDVRYGARFSVTSAESTFHTDNSFGDTVLDYVGLLCLNPAKSGGRSQVVSGYAVREEILTAHPDAGEVLRRPFHVDRRGGLRPGDEPTVRFPVLGDDPHGLLIRYLRYWIEAGHEKVGLPLTAEQVRALDALDQVAGDPRFRVEFTLRPGEMFFVNNRWILHNRTAFEDFDEPRQRRHYVRLWLQRTPNPGGA
jgi:Taurine catabolism dioxygenase TauD, TfdA family